MRILLLSGNTGEGHNSAAKALKEYFEEKGCHCDIHDGLQYMRFSCGNFISWDQQYPEYDIRVSILGHLQRGGSPSASDRILASRMGIAAVQALIEDQRNIMVGLQDDEIVYVPLSKAIKQKKDINADKWAAMQILSI